MSSENEIIKTVLCIDDNFGYSNFWGKVRAIFRNPSADPIKGKTYLVEGENKEMYWFAEFDSYSYGKEHFIVVSERQPT